jgi:hypothetical protein
MLHTQSLSEAALERRSTRGLECLAVARTLAARHGITKTRFVKQHLETLLCTSAPSDPSPQRRGGRRISEGLLPSGKALGYPFIRDSA